MMLIMTRWYSSIWWWCWSEVVFSHMMMLVRWVSGNTGNSPVVGRRLRYKITYGEWAEEQVTNIITNHHHQDCDQDHPHHLDPPGEFLLRGAHINRSLLWSSVSYGDAPGQYIWEMTPKWNGHNHIMMGRVNIIWSTFTNGQYRLSHMVKHQNVITITKIISPPPYNHHYH